MRTPSLRAIAEAVGVIAIVLSLLFLGQEMRQARDIAQSDLRSSMLANGAELNAMIMDHADLWVRGNAGEPLDAAESAVYFRLIQTYNDFYYNLVESSILLGAGWEESDRAMLIGFLHENPGAHKVWREREIALTGWRKELGAHDPPAGVDVNEWVDAVEKGIQRLQAASPGGAE